MCARPLVCQVHDVIVALDGTLLNERSLAEAELRSVLEAQRAEAADAATKVAAMTAEVSDERAISFVWNDSAYFSRVMYMSRRQTEESAPQTKKTMPVMKQFRSRL